MKKLVFVVLMFSGISDAMDINKCIQKNGTISYQKEPCIEDTRTMSEIIKDKKNSKVSSNKQLTEKELSQFVTNNIGDISKHNSSTKNNSFDPLEKPYGYYYNGKVRESVALFKKAISNGSDSFKAWMGYCLSLKDSNRLQSAFIACDKAMSLSAKNPEVYADLIELYISARAWKQGLEFSKRVSQIASNHELISAIHKFGYQAMVVGQIDIAEKAYYLSQKLGGKSEQSQIVFAILNYLKNNKLKAVSAIENILKQSTEHREYLNQLLKQMKSDKTLFDTLDFQESYVKVPKRLLLLGQGKNINQQPDNWVNKLFPLQGIGMIEIEVPENWYELTDYDQTDMFTNEIGIRLMDNSLKKVFISVNVNKAEENWGLENLKELMHSDILKFFKIEKKHINQSDSTYFYEKSGVKKNNEAFQMFFKYSLNKIIVSKIVVLDSTNQHSEITDRIVNSFKIINSDNSVLKAEKSTKQNSKPMMANDMPLPDAPANYSWVRMPQIMAAFLKPNGWYENDKASKDSHTFAFSKESVKQQGSFETGLTIIAIKNVMAKLHLPPYTISLQMYDAIKQNSSNTIVMTKDTSQGLFKSFIVRYENHPEVAPPIIVHKIFIANDKTGSLYIISFEAPKSEWDKAWKIGNTILKYYLVDDEF